MLTLSKNLTFSLKILAILLAVGLVAIPPAMAGEFGVAMSVAPGVDISADGGIQVMSDTAVTVRIRFDKVVDIGTGTGFDASDITVIAYNEFGGVETAPTLGAPTAFNAASPDGKNFSFEVPAPGAAVTRVLLHMPKHGVELADPRAELDGTTRKPEGKSAEANLTIHYVSADAGAPTVYSIRRPSDPLLPLTASDTSVRVVVTLSEKPKEFKKDHISVTEADVDGDPVALDPIPEVTASVVLRQAELTPTFQGGPVPVLRGLYNLVDRHGRSFEPGDHPNVSLASDPGDTVDNRGIHEAINDNADYTDPSLATPGPFTGLPTDAASIPDPLPAPIIVPPTMLAAALVGGTDAGIPDGITLPVGTDRTVDPGDAPKVQDYATGEAFQAAFDFHTARKTMYDAYQAEVERHEAYMAAVEAEMAKDDMALQMYLDVTLTDEDAPVVQTGTGRDMMLHPFVVTLKPKFANKNAIVVKVKMFEDQSDPPQKYIPPTTEAMYVEGRDKLTIKVGYEKPKDDLTAGLIVNLTNKRVIPKDGYLVVATDPAMTGINLPTNADADDNTPKATERTPAELKYNVIKVALPNLETFLSNGGTIDLVAPEKVAISEIMWGSDASLETNSHSQWIEIKNKSGKELKTGDKTYKLIFYGPNEAVPAKGTDGSLPSGVMDRVGTITDTGAYWGLAGKGQSGRSGTGEQATDIVAVVPTQALYSMYRMQNVDGTPATGNMAASWLQATPPAVNFDPAKVGVRVASPGADRIVTAAEAAALAAAEKAKSDAAAAAAAAAADTSVAMPQVGQIYISEVMFAGGGTLPQWIEISNGSRTEVVNLSGWTLKIDNAKDDVDVSVGGSITFTIPEGTKIDPSGQHDTPSTILVVTEQGRTNMDGPKAASQILNLWTDQQTELILAGVTKRRYSLLSDMAFQITLAPKAATPTKVAATATAAEKAAAKAADAKVALEHAAATDTVGNLAADGSAAWALPTDEGDARSSIVRGHIPVSVGPAEPNVGTMMDSWMLSSETSFGQVTHIRASSYYGAANDVGTPGFRAGGALPVELSSFRPARDKITGAVVITWSTQSELNNAGFFIKRSNQRDGEFKVINATMIQGAGTTSEKQSYTYTDTTAQPNVVYYYQIEDISFDGNRQTLTRGIRLKGHVGAAGKVTTKWGELKAQE